MPENVGKPDDRLTRAGRIGWLALLVLILVVVTAIRIRLLNMPLERDEGEYAYGGQLILQGVPMYQGLYTMKWPGTHAAYALIMAIFGQTPAGIHAGLIVVNLATALLVYRLARRIGGDVAGAVAAGTYALLSVNPAMFGEAAHATHFVLLPAVGAILLVQRLDPDTSGLRVFCAGLLLGLAALMKQCGAAFGLGAAGWIVWQELVELPRDRRRLTRRLGLLLLGATLPLLATVGWVARAGTFDHFWFWTYHYARAYALLSTPLEGLERLLDKIGLLFATAPALWVLSALGVLPLIHDASARRFRPFVIGLALSSFLAVCPSWYFRPHYFLLLLPAAGLLAGLAARSGYDLIARRRTPAQATAVVLLVVAGTFLASLWPPREIYFQTPPRQIWRTFYTLDMFVESAEVGDYLKSHCPPSGRIAVLGSEPQIYFYSHRRSATGHIYMYPLTEPQPWAIQMQREMMKEIEAANPDYVVWVFNQGSWMVQSDSPTPIFDWAAKYQREHLRLVAWLEVVAPGQTEYHWSMSAWPDVQHARCWLGIYKNKTAAGAQSSLPPEPR